MGNLIDILQLVRGVTPPPAPLPTHLVDAGADALREVVVVEG
jgi:hypothetical protein